MWRSLTVYLNPRSHSTCIKMSKYFPIGKTLGLALASALLQKIGLVAGGKDLDSVSCIYFNTQESLSHHNQGMGGQERTTSWIQRLVSQWFTGARLSPPVIQKSSNCGISWKRLCMPLQTIERRFKWDQTCRLKVAAKLGIRTRYIFISEHLDKVRHILLTGTNDYF